MASKVIRDYKELIFTLSAGLLLALIIFFFTFYFVDYPGLKASVGSNKDQIRHVDIECKEFKREIREDLKIIKGDIKSLLKRR